MKGATFDSKPLPFATCNDIRKKLLSLKDIDSLCITINLNGMPSDKMCCIFTYMKEFDLKIKSLRIYFYGGTRIFEKQADKTAFDHLIEYLEDENVLSCFTTDFYLASVDSDRLINALMYKPSLDYLVLQEEFYMFIKSNPDQLYRLLKHSYITKCNIAFSSYIEDYMEKNSHSTSRLNSVRDNTRLLCAIPIEDRDVPLITNTKSAAKIT